MSQFSNFSRSFSPAHWVVGNVTEFFFTNSSLTSGGHGVRILILTRFKDLQTNLFMKSSGSPGDMLNGSIIWDLNMDSMNPPSLGETFSHGHCHPIFGMPASGSFIKCAPLTIHWIVVPLSSLSSSSHLVLGWGVGRSACCGYL